jgi:hypothetical protein
MFLFSLVLDITPTLFSQLLLVLLLLVSKLIYIRMRIIASVITDMACSCIKTIVGVFN